MGCHPTTIRTRPHERAPPRQHQVLDYITDSLDALDRKGAIRCRAGDSRSISQSPRPRLDLPQSLRLLGVRPAPLFPEERRRRQVAEAMDAVNDRHGTATVTFGSILGRGGTSRVIAPAWRPEGIRAVDVE